MGDEDILAGGEGEGHDYRILQGKAVSPQYSWGFPLIHVLMESFPALGEVAWNLQVVNQTCSVEVDVVLQVLGIGDSV